MVGQLSCACHYTQQSAIAKMGNAVVKPLAINFKSLTCPKRMTKTQTVLLIPWTMTIMMMTTMMTIDNDDDKNDDDDDNDNEDNCGNDSNNDKYNELIIELNRKASKTQLQSLETQTDDKIDRFCKLFCDHNGWFGRDKTNKQL